MKEIFLVFSLIICMLTADAESVPEQNGNFDLDDMLSLDVNTGKLRITNSSALRNFISEQSSYYKDEDFYMPDDNGIPVKIILDFPSMILLDLLLQGFRSEKIKFYLYDKKDGNKSFDVLKYNDKNTLKNSRFNASRRTVFITHGYTQSTKGETVTHPRDALLEADDFNVITVDWSAVSAGLLYPATRFMTIPVAYHLANFINFCEPLGMDLNSIILIGHSLGAHIMGLAGQNVNKVYHIIGLDPAGPLYYGVKNNQKISADDAQYVTIIHTNAVFCGLPEVLGDFDFIPNGGIYQPGCIENLIKIGCSHIRSVDYLTEQIKTKGENFVAVQCDSYKSFEEGKCSNNNTAIMGTLDIPNTMTRGTYFLNTNKNAPFAMGNNFP